MCRRSYRLTIWIVAIVMLPVVVFARRQGTVTRTGADTAVIGLINLHEMPGKATLSRSMRYFLKKGNDSSRFSCVLHETRESKRLGMDINLAQKTMTWEEEMQELETMMPVIAREFFLDSLSSISLGRLSETGDACADVTRLYREKVSKSKRIPTYQLISSFLLHTSLTARLNRVLAPYGLKVRGYGLEKVFFIPKSSVTVNTRFANSGDIPDPLLDAIMWISIQRK